MANLNEAIIRKDLIKSLNEAVIEEPQGNKRPTGTKEWTFADWFGKDLTGEIYEGSIYCSENQLTSLKGAPKEVKGYFDCSKNQLTSLEGAPEKIEVGFIGGSFNCSENQLTSLEGAPKEVKGYFDCSYNQLTSLEGAPKKVGRDFICCYNQLTSLEGIPEKVGGGFNCSDNRLTSLEGAPKEVKGYFNCSNNKLTSLEGAPKEAEGYFYCSNNQLTSLKGAPGKVGWNFHCSNNQLTSLEGAPEKVDGDFDCRQNPLTSLEGAPEKVGGDFDCPDDLHLRKSVSNKDKKTNHILYWRDSDDNSGTNNGEFEFKTKKELEEWLEKNYKPYFVILNGKEWKQGINNFAKELIDNAGNSVYLGDGGYLGNGISEKEFEFLRSIVSTDEDRFCDAEKDEFDDGLGDCYVTVYMIVDKPEDFDEF